MGAYKRLAYYVEWHMRERLKPMLFDDEQLGSSARQISHEERLLKRADLLRASAPSATRLLQDQASRR